jgi:D-3-phosphoglycerate dehydrogenase
MARILVTEPIAERGIAMLKEAGHDVDQRLTAGPEELLRAVAGAHALIVRSATKVTAEVIDAAKDLLAIGRAGIGLDNIDVSAATRRGILVVNAPQSNVLSAAEHTIALLLAQARNIPQAHAALRSGRWERTRWEGVELHGKTLAVVGLGRIGSLVAQRAAAFGMHVIAYDPLVSEDRARQLGVDLVPDLDQLVADADFLTIHVSKTSETVGLVDGELLARAKPGLRVINTARGEIVDEAHLAEALRTGIVAGAAIDVFAEEPTTSSPLFELENVVVTPHLGASTTEAQDKAGLTIAEQILLALAGDFVPYAVNVSAAEASEAIRPFLTLAERLGRIFASLSQGVPSVFQIDYQGALAQHDTRILTLSVLKGLLSMSMDEPVSYVNAPQLAHERGLEVRESKSSTSHDYVNLITLRGDVHAVAGTLTGVRVEPRIVMVDDHLVEVPPARHMLFVRNDDRVGIVALVSGALAEAGVNIANMTLGRTPGGGTALMVIATDERTPDAVVQRLARAPGILDISNVTDV